MNLIEEPLVTRREILRNVKLGAPTTEAPFTTLRAHGMASTGWSVLIRAESGRMAGRMHLYSVLNLDAARAARLRRPDAARRLATRASALEASDAAHVLRGAVRHASERLSAHLAGKSRDDSWSDRLTRYLEAREGADWDGLDREALAREWLARSEAWLHAWPEREEDLHAAVRELAAGAQAARADETVEEPLRIDSFAGVVRHLDPELAEIANDDEESWVVSRRELDREGLARLGEAVTVIREELPGGGEAWMAAPAVNLRERTDSGPGPDEFSPFVRSLVLKLDARDERWLMRALRRDPVVLPCTPIRVEPGQ